MKTTHTLQHKQNTVLHTIHTNKCICAGYLVMLIYITFLPRAVAQDETLPTQNPSAEEIYRVHTYYNNGDNAIITAAKVCTGIHENPPHKFECMGEITEHISQKKPLLLEKSLQKPLKKGAEYYYWISLLVPQKWDKKIRFRVYFNDTLVRDSTYGASPSLRYRLWKNMPTLQTGIWKITVDQISGTQNEQLQTHPLVRTTYTVE